MFFVVLIFSDHTFPFSGDFNEGWIQFISRVVTNTELSNDARINAADVIKRLEVFSPILY